MSRGRVFSTCSGSFYNSKSNMHLLQDKGSMHVADDKLEERAKPSMTRTFSKQNIVHNSNDYDCKLWKQIKELRLPRNMPEAEQLLKEKNDGYGLMKKEIENIQQDILQLRKKLELNGGPRRQFRSPLSRLQLN